MKGPAAPHPLAAHDLYHRDQEKVAPATGPEDPPLAHGMRNRIADGERRTSRIYHGRAPSAAIRIRQVKVRAVSCVRPNAIELRDFRCDRIRHQNPHTGTKRSIAGVPVSVRSSDPISSGQVDGTRIAPSRTE